MKRLFTTLAISFCICLSAQITPTNYTLQSNWSAGKMKGALDMKFKPSFTIVSPDTLTQTLVMVNYDTTSNYDLFCIYPTLTIGNNTSPANQPINITSKAAADLALNWYVSEFAQFGRVYAPYYRQANLVTFDANTPFAVQSAIFDTALTDVEAAFDYYMQHYNNGKKVILLGYSQGAILGGMLLRQLEIDTISQPYLNKIYLSVLIGMESGPFVTQSSLTGGWWQHVPICQDSTDTACVMSWDAFRYGQPLQYLINRIPFDTDFVSLGFMNQTFNPSTERLYMDHLGFDTAQKKIRYSVYPKSLYQQVTGTGYNVPTDFIGFTDMYYGSISNPDASNFGFMVDRIPNVPNDNRIDPLQQAAGNDFHVYDPYVNTGDVICLIYEKMGKPCPYNFDTTSTAIREVKDNGQFKVMPNPCADNLILTLPASEISKVTIYDMIGEVVGSYSKVTSVDVSTLTKGAYIISVQGKDGRWQQRFVKM